MQAEAHEAEEQRAVQHEAKLYEEGFRAAQRALGLGGGRTTSLSQVAKPTTSLVGKRRLEQIHAEKAINNFLEKGGRHRKPRACRTIASDNPSSRTQRVRTSRAWS